MSKAIEAVYENGVLKPFKRVKLPEHKKFKIILESESKPVTKKSCSLTRIIDIAKNCTDTNLSTRHDKYLYGEIAEWRSLLTPAPSVPPPFQKINTTLKQNP